MISTESGVLELGEAPQTATSSSLYSVELCDPSLIIDDPNFSHDICKPISLNSHDVDDKCMNVEGTNQNDLCSEFNMTPSQWNDLIHLAERDLAKLFNLDDYTVFQGHVSLISVSAGTILFKEFEMQTEMYLVVFGKLDAIQNSNVTNDKVGFLL